MMKLTMGMDFDECIREQINLGRMAQAARWKRAMEQRRKRTHSKNRKNVRKIAKASRRGNR